MQLPLDGMDPQLLALLPDAAKLNVLRHLGGSQPAASQASGQQPQQQPSSQLAELPSAVAGRTLENGIAIIDEFLGRAEVEAARREAQRLLEQRAQSAGMVAATPGQQWASSAVRSDQAAWLQGPAALKAEGRPALAAAVRRLAALQSWLVAQGRDAGGRPSFQLAFYPGGGARYVRHRDASASVPYRGMTAILYLNPEWTPAHGGMLCIYNHSVDGSDPCTASAADLRLAGAATASGTASNQLDAAGENSAPSAAAEHEQQQQQQQPGQPALPSGLDEGHPATVVPPIGGRLVVADSRLLHEVLPANAERYAITAWFSKTPPRTAALTADAAAAAAAVAARAASAATLEAAAPATLKKAEQQRQPVEGTTTAVGDSSAAAAAAAAAQASAAPGSTACRLDASAGTSPGCIFVTVPAYRDSETQWTLADLFAKATHPARVRVGVVWQVQLPKDAALLRMAGDQRWLGQVRQLVLPASEATGPCKARALAQQLWEGEEFCLQIDSHMRFVEGWDAKLLRMLSQAEAAAGHSRVVLSTYPPGYEGEGPDALLPSAPLPTVLCAEGWGSDGLLRIRGRKLTEPLAAPEPALFWAAGMSFSRAQLIKEVPYPHHLPWLFFGEELLQLLRMWQTGWDVYSPSEAVAFHRWSRNHRPTFQQDHEPEEKHAEARRRSQQAVRAALAGLWHEELDSGKGGSSVGASDASASGSSVEKGGVSGSRSLEAFWDHTGVNFRQLSITERARHGGLPPERFLSLPEPWDYC